MRSACARFEYFGGSADANDHCRFSSAPCSPPPQLVVRCDTVPAVTAPRCVTCHERASAAHMPPTKSRSSQSRRRKYARLCWKLSRISCPLPPRPGPVPPLCSGSGWRTAWITTSAPPRSPTSARRPAFPTTPLFGLPFLGVSQLSSPTGSTRTRGLTRHELPLSAAGVKIRNDGGSTLMVAFFPVADNKRFVTVTPGDLQLAGGDSVVVDIKARFPPPAPVPFLPSSRLNSDALSSAWRSTPRFQRSQFSPSPAAPRRPRSSSTRPRASSRTSPSPSSATAGLLSSISSPGTGRPHPPTPW